MYQAKLKKNNFMKKKKQKTEVTYDNLKEIAEDFVSDLDVEFGDELTIANYGKLGKPKTGILIGAILKKNEKVEESGFYYCAEINDLIYKESENDDVSLKDIEGMKNPSKQASFKEMREEDFIKRASDTINQDSGLLYFDANEKDNIIVKRLKELINTKKIRVSTVTSKGFNYNLIYSLMKRNSIDFKTLDKWCEVLNVSLDVSFKPKKSKI